MGREFELKYAADKLVQEAVRGAYTLEWIRYDMATTYYDTPERALGTLRWTLRRRYENGRAICTVKTPAPGGGRGEWETECDDISAAIPTLCALGAPAELAALTKNGVTEVCGARFTRLAGALTLADCTLELALDSGVLTGGGRETPLCEIEVELKSGSEDAATAFAQALAAQFGLSPEKKSKFRRALALAEER